MENYAAYMAYTDFQVGRLIDSLAASGELDNTLVMYIVGDNGASAEGGLEGTFSELASLLGVQLGLAKHDQADRRDRRADQRAARSRRLGVGDGRAVPVDQAGRLATSAAPATRWSFTGPRGSRRRARSAASSTTSSTSCRRSWRRARSPSRRWSTASRRSRSKACRWSTPSTTPSAKSKRTTQYFELATNRAIYHDGWVACSRYGYPWVTLGRSGRFPQGPVGALQHRE